MLIILVAEDKFKIAEEVDRVVRAEIPDPPQPLPEDATDAQIKQHEQATRLRQLVVSHMIHGPCGKKNPKARCMYDADGILTDICHKSFPKNYRTETAWDDASSYATYRRRTPQDGGGEAKKIVIF